MKSRYLLSILLLILVTACNSEDKVEDIKVVSFNIRYDNPL